MRLIAHLTWFNPSLTYWFPDSDEIHSRIVNLFGLATVVAIVACIFNGPIIDFIGKEIVNFSKFNAQAPVVQEIADEVIFRRFQGEAVEFS